jgi:hypothetical protein
LGDQADHLVRVADEADAESVIAEHHRHRVVAEVADFDDDLPGLQPGQGPVLSQSWMSPQLTENQRDLV